MVYKNSETFKKSQKNNALKLIEERGHIYISGEYETKDSDLEVACLEHKQLQTTTFTNYTRSKTGLLCCGRAQVSKKLNGRKFTAETIQKMIQANNKKPFRGGKHRKWREEHTYHQWRKSVLDLYGNTCAVTGVKAYENNKVVVHHLNGAHENPDLVNVTENGIPLLEEIHKNFHGIYGYTSNSLEDFQHYLLKLLEDQNKRQSMPISSQSNLGGLEGSETRVYNPARVMKLHERLEGYKKVFLDE